MEDVYFLKEPLAVLVDHMIGLRVGGRPGLFKDGVIYFAVESDGPDFRSRYGGSLSVLVDRKDY